MKLKDINHVGIVGTGMIGTSLAVLLTGHGYRTTLLAVDDNLAEESRKKFDAYYQDMVDSKVITKEQADICARYVRYTTNYTDLADIDYAFEAVVEQLPVKHEVYHQLEKYCGGLKLIMSVTSAIPAEDLPKGLEKYGDRVIVTHPFNPPHLVPYFEVVKSQATADGITDLAKEFLESVDRKVVVLKKSVPGFLGTRLQFAMIREAFNIVQSGIADARDVDLAAMYSFMPRFTAIGIFEHLDNGGLQLAATVSGNLFPHLSNEDKVPAVLQEKIDHNQLGVKTGVGFYDWRGVDLKDLNDRIAAPWWRLFNWDLPKE